MKKQFLAFLIMLMPMAAMASVEVGDFFYELNGTEATLVSHSSYTSFLSGSISIPSNVLYNATNYRVTSLGDYAFSDCTGLTSVTIPNSVTSIGISAFYGCTGILSITIPNSVTSIGAGAFTGCSSLTSITLPSNLTNIETRVFDGCNGLTSIIIPNSVTTIGGYAFDGCRNLSSIIIPNSVTRIEEHAFGYFSGLTSITIPSSVNYIGDNAFIGCGYLTSMYVNISNPLNFGDFFPAPLRSNVTLYVPYGSKEAYETSDYWQGFKSIEETILFEDTKVKEICIANWDTDHDGNLSKEEAAAVTGLGNSFRASDITSFNELQYFTGLKGITEEAFKYCTNLSSIIIPSNITYIDAYAFSQCNRLTSINIPSKVTAIYEEAFYGCLGLSSITLPDGLLIIGNNAFTGCSNLISINIPNNVYSLGERAFAGCQNLSSITIPRRVTTIEEGTFRGCSSLTMVTILSNLNIIKDCAFGGCSSLSSFTIPKGVDYIGDCAFYDCTNLTSVYVNVRTPLYADNEDNDIFPLRTNATLYVPYGCKAIYEAADYWSDFKEILEMNPTELDITIGEARIATYCSEFDLDFTETDVKAYIVSAFTPRTGKVILTRIYDVPAGTGIVVMGDEGEHQIPVVEAQTVVSNMLVGVTEATELNKVDGDYTNYIFAQKNGELGFYAVADGSTLGAHKAYLPLPTAKLPSSAEVKVAFTFDDDGVATGIDNVNPTIDTPTSIYSITGQRQIGLRKGLNIVDGRKVYVK